MKTKLLREDRVYFSLKKGPQVFKYILAVFLLAVAYNNPMELETRVCLIPDIFFSFDY